MTLSDFPNNSQFALFFREFVMFGYKSSTDAIVCKFPYADGSRQLEPFSVGMSDGFTKVLLMFALVGFLEELEVGVEEAALLKDQLATFKYVRCCYEHFSKPSHHHLHALRLLAMLTVCSFGVTCLTFYHVLHTQC